MVCDIASGPFELDPLLDHIEDRTEFRNLSGRSASFSSTYCVSAVAELVQSPRFVIELSKNSHMRPTT